MPQNNSDNKLNAELRKLDDRLDILRREYEKYFRGARERPPNNKRKQVERQLRELEQTKFTNTSLKFRFRSLLQRFNTYKQKWNRIQRQKERGTYEPDKQKAKRRAERQAQQEDGNQQDEADEPPEENDADADQEEGIKQNEDGSFSLEMAEDMDLKGLEEELQKMDEQGEFEQHVETARLEDAELPDPDASNTGETTEETLSDSPTAPSSEPPTSDASSSRPQETDHDAESREDASKRERIRSLQDELGLSGRSSDSPDERGEGGDHARSGDDTLKERREKLDRMRRDVEADESDQSRAPETSPSTSTPDRGDDEFDRQSTQKVDRANPDAPSRGAKPEQLRELLEKRRQQKQEKSHRESDSRGETASPTSGSRGRSVDRSARSGRDGGAEGSSDSSSEDEDEAEARRIYRRLLQAKRDCGESTDHLDFESVKASMRQQTRRLQQERDVSSVQFQVVKKDGRAFLKPEIH